MSSNWSPQRKTIDAPSALLRTLAEQQDLIAEILRDICDKVEGTDDSYGLFEQGGSEP